MDLLERMQKLKEQQEIKVEKTLEKSQEKKIFPERLNESQVQPKKWKIDLDLLNKSLDRTTGFDISNIHISQDDLWILFRLKFGKGTRAKRSVLLPKFTDAFNKNLKEMKE